MSFEVDSGCVIAQVSEMCGTAFANDAKKYQRLNDAMTVLREHKLSVDDNHAQMIDDIVLKWYRTLLIKPSDVVAMFDDYNGKIKTTQE